MLKQLNSRDWTNICPKVLLVDDCEINRKIALRQLKNKYTHIHIDIAKNGKEGLDLFNIKFYDVVLMDCEMPVMNGFKAVETMRKLESERQTKHTHIIAMTANVSSNSMDKCMRAGMDTFIPKPADWSMVFKILDIEFIERKSALQLVSKMLGNDMSL